MSGICMSLSWNDSKDDSRRPKCYYPFAGYPSLAVLTMTLAMHDKMMTCCRRQQAAQALLPLCGGP